MLELLTALKAEACSQQLHLNCFLVSKMWLCAPAGHVKERGRSKGSSLRSRSRAEAQAEEVGGEAERQEQAALEECEPYLRSVLLHWESLPPPPSPAPALVSQGDLAAPTAHLLVKWTLRSLVTATAQDGAETLFFLRWVRANVLPLGAAVDAVLADDAAMRDFLRLYHRACEPDPGSSSGPAVAETVEVFTAVMVALLEARGGLKEELHRAVLTSCLCEPQEDDSRRGEIIPTVTVKRV